MISLVAARELYDYNCWARNRQLEACASLTEEQFLLPLGGGFQSVRDTLAHLVDNEAYYLHRWRGETRERIVAIMGFSRSEERARLWPRQFPTLAHIERQWKHVEQEIRAFLAQLAEKDLSREVSYIDSRGRTSVFALWRLMLHLTNHQSYHRGQVATLLRRLGAPAPQTDYLLGLADEFRMRRT